MADQATLAAPERRALAVRIADALLERQVVWDKQVEADTGAPPTDPDSAAWVEDELQGELESLAAERTRNGLAMLTERAEDDLAQAVRVRLSPMQVLGELLDDPRIENILVNDYDTTWIVEAGGRKYRGPALAGSEDELNTQLRRLGSLYGRSERRFDAAHPTLDVQLPGGHRLNAL
ncbi:MAG: hypothetical protein GY701_00610, partial [Sulfitobacter sp.]|nr:hypothetical protein [Sulfitobacter sp.]